MKTCCRPRATVMTTTGPRLSTLIQYIRICYTYMRYTFAASSPPTQQTPTRNIHDASPSRFLAVLSVQMQAGPLTVGEAILSIRVLSCPVRCWLAAGHPLHAIIWSRVYATRWTVRIMHLVLPCMALGLNTCTPVGVVLRTATASVGLDEVLHCRLYISTCPCPCTRSFCTPVAALFRV